MPFAWEVDPASIGSTALDYNYGDADEFRADIESAIEAYGALDFPTEVNLLPGVAHCAFDHIGWITESWEAYLDAR